MLVSNELKENMYSKSMINVLNSKRRKYQEDIAKQYIIGLL